MKNLHLRAAVSCYCNHCIGSLSTEEVCFHGKLLADRQPVRGTDGGNAAIVAMLGTTTSKPVPLQAAVAGQWPAEQNQSTYPNIFPLA